LAFYCKFEGFNSQEEAMLHLALDDLEAVGYDLSAVKELIRADLPARCRGMSWPEGAILGRAAFASQAVLNHVLVEELIHLQQKMFELAHEFGPGTADALEEAADESRKFPDPGRHA
jgi:hypothetical protein